MAARHPLLATCVAFSLLLAVATYDVHHISTSRRRINALRLEQGTAWSHDRWAYEGRRTPDGSSATVGTGGRASGNVTAQLRALLASMTLADKIGQITQLDVTSVVDERSLLKLDVAAARTYARLGIGSFLNSPTAGGPRAGLSSPSSDTWRSFLTSLADVYRAEGKIPPVFGIDSMHGANYVRDAVLFPHALNVAASFSLENAYNSARATAQSTRNAGIPWVFAPVLDVAMTPRFARVYETFGEDPWLISAMGVAAVQGLQGQPFDTAAAKGGAPFAGIPADLGRSDVVGACMKHFVGYMASRSGYDRAPPWLPEVQLRSLFLPPFAAAVRAGVASAMTSYTSADGLPLTVSRKWTKRWLRREANFTGLLVTDWLNIYNVITDHFSAETGREAVELVMRRSSTDMVRRLDWSHWCME